MDGLMLEHENDTPHHRIETMYLSEKTGDVQFVFGTKPDKLVRVSAHKSILSTGSLVFDLMFYGPWPDTGDIKVEATTVDEFKEFLQFFYFSKVRLTPKNLTGVMILCERYEMHDGLKICKKILQNVITVDYVCWCYGIAIFFQQKKLVVSCEQKIIDNISDILKTNTFLESKPQILGKILRLVVDKCDPFETIGACMKWAKTICTRNNWETNSKNLRTALHDAFDHMPFDKLPLEEFSTYIVEYRGFFTATEMETIIAKIATENIRNRTFQCQPRVLVFDRQICDTKKGLKEYTNFLDLPYMWKSTFNTNKQLLLTDVYMKLKRSKICQTQINGWCVITSMNAAKEREIRKIEFVIMVGKNEIRINVPEGVIIDENKCCNVCMHIEICCDDCYLRVAHKNMALASDDAFIQFHDAKNNDFISKLVFQIPKEERK